MFKERELIIKELRELFNIGLENHLSSESKGMFYIMKQDFERLDVTGKLHEYFNGVFVKDGYVKVSPITMVFTSFEICKGKPED